MGRLINAPRAAGLLRRLFVIPGEDPARELEDAVTPVLELEQSTRERAEHCFSRGERLWVISNVVNPVVGEVASFGVRNPARSGLITVITGFQFGAPQTGVIQFSLRAAGVLGVVRRARLRDVRFGRNTRGTTVGFDLTVAAGGGDVISQHRTASQLRLNLGDAGPFPLVLGPGEELHGDFSIANESAFYTYTGYEREAQRGEVPVT